MLSRKTLVTVIAAAAVALVAVMPAAAQEIPNVITVTGTGEAQAAPDKVTIEVGVEQFSPEVKDAFAAVNQNVRAVVEAVVAVGVDATDITTSNLSVFNTSRYSPEGVEERGFQVSNTVRVVVRNAENIEAVIDAAINAGANIIYGLTFSVTDPSASEAEARVNAMEDARARAQQLAELIGATLGDVVAVSEGGANAYPMFNFEATSARQMGGGGGAYIEPGQQTVTVTLQVAFAIVR